ncbi:MAG TPA: DNA polymerase III subunit alpha [Pyrinomonadaceae bacterium]|nr:DNA polymerase III subunit alpha [Pyrinomonadaceae bacterium]
MAQKVERPVFGSKDFVHLHLHTDYSLLQSTIQLKPLAKRLKELDMRACAITDYGNMYGAVSYFNVMSGNGIQPIIGIEAHLTFGSRLDRTSSVGAGERGYYNIILLARDVEGYQNLIHLSSSAFTEGFHHKPRIDIELLSQRSKGLIGLSAGIDGAVSHFLLTGNEEKALSNAKLFEDIFGKGNYYLEIQDRVDERGQKLIADTVALSKQSGIELVATNDVHYMNADDARAQQVLIAIGEGRTVGDNRETAAAIRYLRSAEEMWDIFGAELPQSLNNTMKIAEMCDLDIPQGDDVRQLPNYPIPVSEGDISVDDYFEKVLWEGFEERKKTEWEPMRELGTLKHTMEEYEERLRIEIATIKRMGFPGYFLIVWDFIAYAKDKGIPVGPGRGSAAGSLAAFCMRITDVDPIQYDLLFERFLNPERISMPDIDIDFCIRGRGDVISHVTEFYGKESVCQIITFGTMASRAAIKDVGRALNMPYGDVEKIAKLIPPPIRGRNVSISQALETVPELKAATKDAKVKELVDLALRLEGCSRHTSVHAAGVVISPKPLHELVPVALSGKDELTSQYPMGDLEKVGMLKMDFLGLTTLTVIADCLASMKEKLGVTIDWAKIPTDDQKTMELFGEGRTEAIFQFESSGMADMCRRLRPKELEDLSALNALYRPGPLDGGMIDDFIDRHRGLKPVEYVLPEMEAILGNTFGVLVYQEQIMQLAQRLAGYSLGQADLMRRAMGKKKIEEMAVHEQTFVDGAVANKIPKKTAKEIFDLMAKFADYGFNRSHSMAYAVLAFQTAYLKAHYPAYFYASVLSHEAQDSAKVYKYSTELKSMGLSLLPPDVNESGDGFTPVEDTVRYGLTAIKGMGSSSVAAIVEARKTGRFTSLFDFCSRMNAGAVNRRGLESLVAAGAFDSMMPDGEETGSWRARLHSAIEPALQQGQRMAEDRLRGQSGLFGAVETSSDDVQTLPKATPWTQAELATREKAAIGFYLSTHPLDNYKELLDGINLKNIADIGDMNSGDMVTLAGMISGLQIRTSKKGNRFAMFRFEDRSSGMKAVVLGENFNKLSPLLADDQMFIADGKIEAPDGQEPTLMINELRSLDETIATRARAISITIPGQTDEAYFESLYSLLERERGRCGVILSIKAGDTRVKLEAGGLSVTGSRSLQRELEGRGCAVEWVN